MLARLRLRKILHYNTIQIRLKIKLFKKENAKPHPGSGEEGRGIEKCRKSVTYYLTGP
jgi:hypothetical protein